MAQDLNTFGFEQFLAGPILLNDFEADVIFNF
jgi:hypothetical protein